jgi:acyl carrier protein
VRDDESLREQLDIDSMDLLRFAQAIHARLGVDVPEVDQGVLDVLEDAVAYLGSRVA